MGVQEDLEDLKHNTIEIPESAWARREEPEVRELIVLATWPMLTRVVGRIRQGLPPHVRAEEGDLRTYGLLELYKAIDRYDPSLGHEFNKYASNAVRRGVLDALRSLDWAPRGLRKRQRDLSKAEQDLQKRLQRKPTDDEIAEALKWTTHDISVTRKQVDVAWPRSLDEIRFTSEMDMYAIVADAQGTPEDTYLRAHESHENDRSAILIDTTASFIESMPPQKRMVAILRYFLKLRQSEVAQVLGIPESKVSAIHRSVLDEIHEKLEALLADEG